jgi:hypothetical protein
MEKSAPASDGLVSIKTMEWRGFTIAYDMPKRLSLVNRIRSLYATFTNRCLSMRYVLRLYLECWTIAPALFTCYIIGSWWASVVPALCLSLAYKTIYTVCFILRLIPRQLADCWLTETQVQDYLAEAREPNAHLLYLGFGWLLLEGSGPAIEYLLSSHNFPLSHINVLRHYYFRNEIRLELGARSQKHFLPQLARGSFSSIQETLVSYAVIFDS